MKFIDQVKVFNSSTVQPLWNHFLQNIILTFHAQASSRLPR
jgi:hypothetical protein